MKLLKLKPSTLLKITSIFAFTAILVISLSSKASALSGVDFDPGRIIDDSVFFNKNGMSVDQIQNFLNAKVPYCDSWGTQPYGGTTRAAYAASKGVSTPFTCLKNYSESTITKPGNSYCSGTFTGGTKSSARIIYDAAQACNINPKVLLILLQKEQSLVTDDWPWPIQYRSATGYGCPDTAPCDSEYYGFSNQVYQAAKAYKRYQANSGSYNYRAGRNNSILWNPNAGCGRSDVYIQNQATAGLYIYTPYRPNQAALNNLYGTGDGCSSYGNRNFWRMYNDWFGSTMSNTNDIYLSSLSVNGTSYVFFANFSGVYVTYWGSASTNNQKLTKWINKLESVTDIAVNKSASGLFQVFSATHDGVYETYWSNDINAQKTTGKVADINGAKAVYGNVANGFSQIFTATDSGVYETYWGSQQTNNRKITGRVADINGAKAVYGNVANGFSQIFTATDSGVYETYWGSQQTSNRKVTGRVADINGAKAVYGNVANGFSQIFTATDSGVYETYWGSQQTNNRKITGRVADMYSLPQ